MAPNACSGDGGGTSGGTTTTTTTMTTTTTAAANCITGWIGDGYCDAENNVAGCQYDGGDCCEPHAHNWWDYYCKGANVRLVKSNQMLEYEHNWIFFRHVSAKLKLLPLPPPRPRLQPNLLSVLIFGKMMDIVIPETIFRNVNMTVVIAAINLFLIGTLIVAM